MTKDKTDLLSDNFRELMYEFSRRCIDRFRSALTFRVFLSFIQDFLDANVRKETTKDMLIIDRAVHAFEAGRKIGDLDLEEIFEATKKIDRGFIEKVSVPLLSLEVRYDDIREIRKKRILSLTAIVFTMMSNWEAAASFEDLVKHSYTKDGFSEALGEILHLYNLETRMLSGSIALHSPMGAVKELLASKLYSHMEEVARGLISEYCGRIYGSGSLSCVERT